MWPCDIEIDPICLVIIYNIVMLINAFTNINKQLATHLLQYLLVFVILVYKN